MTEEDRGQGLPAGARHYRAYVGLPQRYDELASLQFRVISDLGLRDYHNVLDLGCGSLRAGRLLLPYLLPRRYVGVEPEEWLIREGIRRELGASILETKEPQFCHDSECPLDHFGRLFDYILVQSVFTHAPFEWIERGVPRLARAIARPHGLVVGTYLEGTADYTGTEWAYPECIQYRRETLHRLCTASGLDLRILDQYPHPAGVTWFTLTALA